MKPEDHVRPDSCQARSDLGVQQNDGSGSTRFDKQQIKRGCFEAHSHQKWSNYIYIYQTHQSVLMSKHPKYHKVSKFYVKLWLLQWRRGWLWSLDVFRWSRPQETTEDSCRIAQPGRSLWCEVGQDATLWCAARCCSGLHYPSGSLTKIGRMRECDAVTIRHTIDIYWQ